MSIPKYIERKMRKANRLFREASDLMDTVNEWFDSHGYVMEDLRDGDGRSLEEIEYGTEGVVDRFLEKLDEMEKET